MESITTSTDNAIQNLSRTYIRSQTIGELAAALSKTQGALQPAKQTKEQGAFKTGGKYAGLDDAWTSARVPLAANGLSIIQMPVDSSRDGWVSLTTLLAHSSNEWIEATFSMPVEKQTAHGYGSCVSYLRRYSLNAFIGLVSTADYENDDGNLASGVVTHAAKAAPIVKPAGFDSFNQRLKTIMAKKASTKIEADKRKDDAAKVYEAGSLDCKRYLAQQHPDVSEKLKALVKSQ
jgi:hypothetical protein